jgi:hypothetical protein
MSLALVLGTLFAAEFLSGFGVMLLDIGVGSIFAAVIPDELRSRVSGAFQAVNYCTRPLGARHQTQATPRNLPQVQRRRPPSAARVPHRPPARPPRAPRARPPAPAARRQGGLTMPTFISPWFVHVEPRRGFPVVPAIILGIRAQLLT